MPTKITPDQIAKMTMDFNTLLDDIVAALPPSSQLSLALMFLKMAETMVVTMFQQGMIGGH